jgi:hypothetical protein
MTSEVAYGMYRSTGRLSACPQTLCNLNLAVKAVLSLQQDLSLLGDLLTIEYPGELPGR